MLLDIVILPPRAVRNFIQKSVALLPKRKLKLVVDNRQLIPHVSLFHLNIRTSDLPAVILEARGIAGSTKKFSLKIKGVHAGKIAFDYSIQKSKPLYQLHRRVVLGLKDFRLGQMPTVWPVSLEKRKMMRVYGSPSVLRNYIPHITLGIPKRMQEAGSLVEVFPMPKTIMFPANAIAVTSVNSYWQVTKILKTFRLI